MQNLNTYKLGGRGPLRFLLWSALALSASLSEAQVPGVFRVSEGVRPNAVVSLYGEYLTGTAAVRFLKADGTVASTQPAIQTDPGGHFCRVVFPAIPPGAYQLAVRNGVGWSTQTIYVNRAEPRWISEERAYPGLSIKVIGRNLDASEYNGRQNTEVRMAPVHGGKPIVIAPQSTNPYGVDFTIPKDLPAGNYYVEVNAHSAEFGDNWVRLNNHSEFPDTVRDTVVQVGATPTDPTALALKVAWANDFNWTNVIDARRDYRARGDGFADDTQAIQRALDDATARGGGVVHLPNGVYKVDGLTLGSGCILRGENREQTIIAVSRTEGEAIVAKGSRHGIAQLTLRYQAQAPNDVQSTLLGGDADQLFLHHVTFDLLRNPDVPVQHSPYYVAGPGPMLVAGCRFFISSRNLWNHNVRNRVTFRDNFIDMHDGLGLCMSSEKLLVLDNELVFHPAAYAGQMNGFFLNEGWMGWNIFNAYIAGNKAHDLNGPGDCQPYAADSAWSCVAGAVTSASTNTVEVRNDMSGDFKGLDTHELELIVVQGRGLGQLRRVSARKHLGGDPAVVRFTVSPAWDVPPDATSMVSVGCWHVNNVFFRNQARRAKSPYNMYYGGSYDCVDAEAVSEDTEGWYNWGRIGEYPSKPPWHCPVYFSQLKRSTFTGKSPAYSTMGLTLRVENETTRYRGIGDYGTEIRDNLIDRSACSNASQRLAGNAAIATRNQVWTNLTGGTPLVFATLCEGNRIQNSAVGFDLNQSYSFAIRGTGYENCPRAVNDHGFDTALLPGAPAPVAPAAATTTNLNYAVSWVGNSFSGADDKWVQNFFIHMSTTPDGSCYTWSHWDEGGQKFGVYRDGKVAGNQDVKANSLSVKDHQGRTWTISVQYTDPQHQEWDFIPQGIQCEGKTIAFPELVQPTALALANDGRLMVADSLTGPRQQVLFYDISDPGHPKLMKAFGDYGGIASGTPGEVTPTKFWGIRGIGMDAQDNLYVAMSEMGTVLRKFTPAGKLVWELYGHFFVDVACADPLTDGKDVWAVQEHYVMDYTQPAGQQAKWAGYSLDRHKYPNDPRGLMFVKQQGEHGLTSPQVVYLKGRRFLFVGGMFASNFINIFRYDRDGLGEMAIPAGLIMQWGHGLYNTGLHWPPQRPEGKPFIWRDLNGDGDYQAAEYAPNTDRVQPGPFYVDKLGNIWMANGFFRYDFQGLDERGNPIYSADKITVMEKPKGMKDVARVCYDSDTDTLVAAEQGVEEHGRADMRHIGRIFVCRNYLAGNRDAISFTSGAGRQAACVAATGDYVFTGGWKERGRVHVNRLSDGAPMGVLDPGPTVGGVEKTGWVDILTGITAHQQHDGAYLVFIEEDYRAKSILYRWRP